MDNENAVVKEPAPNVWHLLLTGFAMAAGAYLFEIAIRRRFE